MEYGDGRDCLQPPAFPAAPFAPPPPPRNQVGNGLDFPEGDAKRCLTQSSLCLLADPIEIHKRKLFLWFSHLPREEKQFGGYFSPDTMHVDPMIVERKAAERVGLLGSPFRARDLSSSSVTIEQLFEPADRSVGRGVNVLLYGAVGTGKSTVFRKLVLDWCRGTSLNHFKLLIPFSCEDLSQMTK